MPLKVARWAAEIRGNMSDVVGIQRDLESEGDDAGRMRGYRL